MDGLAPKTPASDAEGGGLAPKAPAADGGGEDLTPKNPSLNVGGGALAPKTPAADGGGEAFLPNDGPLAVPLRAGWPAPSLERELNEGIVPLNGLDLPEGCAEIPLVSKMQASGVKIHLLSECTICLPVFAALGLPKTEPFAFGA